MSKYFLFTKEIKPKRIKELSPSLQACEQFAKVHTHICVASKQLWDSPVR